MFAMVWLRRCFLLLPGLLAATAVFWTAEELGDPRQLPFWLESLPLVLLCITIMLGLIFRQLGMALLGCFLASILLQCAPHSKEASALTIRAALLLPIWFGFCGLLRNARVFSLKGFLLLFLTLVICASLFAPAIATVDDRLEALIGMVSPAQWNSVSALPFVALVLAAISMLILFFFGGRWMGVLLVQSMLLGMLALDAGGPVLEDHALVLFTSAISASVFVLVWAVLTAAWRHAFIDELTGLPGRRALVQDMAGLSKRQALAIVDADHFKKVNDRHGHDVGDQVLRFISTRLRLFRYGTAYRFGGEEFVIILRGAKADVHLKRLDMLRKDIGDRGFALRGSDRPKKKPPGSRKKTSTRAKTIKITVSIGMAMRSAKSVTPHEVLQAADKALYRAKRGGRNRVARA